MSGDTNEMEFFGLEPRDKMPKPTVSQVHKVLLDESTHDRVKKTVAQRNLDRRHADKQTLLQLYSLRQQFCPICMEPQMLENYSLLSLSFISSHFYKLFSTKTASAQVLRKIFQAGAPPLWLYLCRGCHSQVSTSTTRPSNDELVAGFGKTFAEWQEEVKRLAAEYVVPAYKLRGGTPNLEYMAMGMFGHLLPLPNFDYIPGTWLESLPRDYKDAVGDILAQIDAAVSGVGPMGTANALHLAAALDANMREVSENINPTEFYQMTKTWIKERPTSLNSVTRETLVNHYTNGKNACEDCGKTEVAELRVVTIGGDALKIRQDCAKQFKRLFPRRMAQAGYPGDVKILCAGCHVLYMRGNSQTNDYE